MPSLCSPAMQAASTPSPPSTPLSLDMRPMSRSGSRVGSRQPSPVLPLAALRPVGGVARDRRSDQLRVATASSVLTSGRSTPLGTDGQLSPKSSKASASQLLRMCQDGPVRVLRESVSNVSTPSTSRLASDSAQSLSGRSPSTPRLSTGAERPSSGSIRLDGVGRPQSGKSLAAAGAALTGSAFRLPPNDEAARRPSLLKLEEERSHQPQLAQLLQALQMQQNKSPQQPAESPKGRNLRERRSFGRRMSDIQVVNNAPYSTSLPWALGPVPHNDIKVLEEREKIFDRYTWKEVLQEEGDGGKVVVCTPKRPSSAGGSPTQYVMKIRSKESLQADSMEDTFRLAQLKMLNLPPHVGVLPLHEVLEDSRFYYVVMKKASGGSFFTGLLSEFKDGNMPQSAVKKLMRGIIEAVGHIHSQGMLHRDIKPDNLVMHFCDDVGSPTGKTRKVAIIDFDHADPDWSPKFKSSQQGFCGTMRFSAPETFQGFFSQSSDLYSVGVILYMLLSGKMPYDDSIYDEELARLERSPKARAWLGKVSDRLKDHPIDWDCSPWPNEPQCQDFCNSMLAFDPDDRPSSSEEALAHEWFKS